MEFEVFSIADSGWRNKLEDIQSEYKDVYFLPEWYSTWLEHEKAEAYCIYAECDGFQFIYPFLKRKINNFKLSREYFDIQSAYGYGGIIVNDQNVTDDIINLFNDKVDDYLLQENVIAEFIRVHPLLDSIKRPAEYSIVRKNVFVKTNDHYKVPSKQARQNIAKALSYSPEILFDDQMSHLNEFIQLYQHTAERIGMNDYYRFSEKYFNSVKSRLRGKSTLIILKVNNTIIGGGLLIYDGNKSSLHLAASQGEYLHMRPNDLLYYAAIKYSIEHRIEFLNLGGGLSTDENDSLFKFKSKYSDLHKDVFVGKKIINHEVYSRIINEWEAKHPELSTKYSRYFLKYELEN